MSDTIQEKTDLEKLEELSSLILQHAIVINQEKRLDAEYNIKALLFKVSKGLSASAPFDVDALLTKERARIQQEKAQADNLQARVEAADRAK